MIDRCESFLLGNGRDFLRTVLESALPNQAKILEKKGGPPNLPCGASGRHKGKATKTVMTALGAIVLWRTYFSCNVCRLGGYATDRVLGLEGFLTRQATRLICPAWRPKLLRCL